MELNPYIAHQRSAESANLYHHRLVDGHKSYAHHITTFRKCLVATLPIIYQDLYTENKLMKILVRKILWPKRISDDLVAAHRTSKNLVEIFQCLGYTGGKNSGLDVRIIRITKRLMVRKRYILV